MFLLSKELIFRYMITEKEQIRISKFLSLVLRHQPELIGLQLNEQGWAHIETLLEKSAAYGVSFDKQTLKYLVATNSKKRFAFSPDAEYVRASQGHSVDIELGYKNQKPPEILYHGTAEKFMQSILETGLEKCRRQHVHLSSTIETAIHVGQRHGKPVVFTVLAQQMYANDFSFYLSDNGVWLTDHVPVIYLTINP
ncbi:RNA 2'-phosphotransferase [Cytophaga hutchinsonii ATCC 33406]|uniref:Probable RNA 2'-phosphotransferase n=2 Tax=Cytophaga hutchinsonii TaxID=985 RepID=A0A6N4STN9_CYTH3|nr:RNA 2'-phosphotransferase [Cytophaga hutchinsonii ATCC 33406]